MHADQQEREAQADAILARIAPRDMQRLADALARVLISSAQRTASPSETTETSQKPTRLRAAR